MTRLWLVRHGPTHATGMVGWSDLPADLSDAAAVARLAAALPFGAPVVSSDLARAVATADALQGARPRRAHDPALREIHFGAWELKRHDQIAAEDAALARAFWERPGSVRPPGGESWDQMAARVAAAIDRHAAGLADLIVVAHFGAILAAIGHATGAPPAALFGERIDPLSLTIVQHAPAGAGRLIAANLRP